MIFSFILFSLYSMANTLHYRIVCTSDCLYCFPTRRVHLQVAGSCFSSFLHFFMQTHRQSFSSTYCTRKLHVTRHAHRHSECSCTSRMEVFPPAEEVTRTGMVRYLVGSHSRMPGEWAQEPWHRVTLTNWGLIPRFPVPGSTGTIAV